MGWDSANTLSRHMLLWMADASIRAAIVATLASLAIWFLHKRSGAQHATWTLVLAAMLGLPFFRPALPSVHIPAIRTLAPISGKIAAIRSSPRYSGIIRQQPKPRMSQGPAAPPFSPGWPVIAMAAYLAVVALFGARLLAGTLWTRRLLRKAGSMDSDLWMYYELVADADAYVTIQESDRVRVPVTIGLRHMRVILPPDWREWPAANLKSVLAHELAHVGRRDPFTAFIAGVNRCIFWFHPLAWWLERRLAVLAEHAADEAGLSAARDAETYAHLLLNTAARLQTDGNRLTWNAVAMSGPVIARRIRRVLELPANPPKPLGKLPAAALLSIGVALILGSTTLDMGNLSAAQSSPVATLSGRLPGVPTAAEVAVLEQQLAENPEDEKSRDKLLTYYGIHGMPDRSLPLLLWLIDHHPESARFGYGTYPGRTSTDREVREDIRKRWRAQVAQHPDDARVLCNAAQFLGNDNLPEGIDLLKRARGLDPGFATEPLARIYSIVLSAIYQTHMHQPWKDASFAAQIRSELAQSNDLGLIGTVARYVVERGAQATLVHEGNWDFNGSRSLAAELVTHAHSLDPQSPLWPDLMEGVKGFEVGLPPPESQPPPPDHAVIHIDPKFAQSMLQESPAPKYPSFPNAQNMEGVVNVEIHIGMDGHVTEALMLGGPRILASAGMDAALRYVYRPIIIKGEAVEAVTTVDIPFSAR